jgi:hypothetical protein
VVADPYTNFSKRISMMLIPIFEKEDSQNQVNFESLLLVLMHVEGPSTVSRQILRSAPLGEQDCFSLQEKPFSSKGLYRSTQMKH